MEKKLAGTLEMYKSDAYRQKIIKAIFFTVIKIHFSSQATQLPKKPTPT